MTNRRRLPEDFVNLDLGNMTEDGLVSLIIKLRPDISIEALKTSDGTLISRYGLIQRVLKYNRENTNTYCPPLSEEDLQTYVF